MMIVICVFLGLGGLKLLTTELGFIAGRGKREPETRKRTAGTQSIGKSKSK